MYTRLKAVIIIFTQYPPQVKDLLCKNQKCIKLVRSLTGNDMRGSGHAVSGIKIVIQLILFVTFLVHFGIPSLRKYEKEETIIVTSEVKTNGIEAPPVSVAVYQGHQGTAWKSTQGQITWDTFDLVQHCENIDMPDIERCMRNDSFELQDFMREIYFGFPVKNMSISKTPGPPSLPSVPSSLEEDMSSTPLGRIFTIKATKMITPYYQDFMVLILNRNFSFFIFLHDEEYFLLNINSFGPPSVLRMYANLSQSQSHYYEISLTKHKRLNIGRSPCIEEKNYSFKSCVKNSFSKQVRMSLLSLFCLIFHCHCITRQTTYLNQKRQS